MTTFTMQDLTNRNINDLPTTPEEDEAMEALTQQQPTPAPIDSIILDNLAIPRAPEPQPTFGTPVPNKDVDLALVLRSIAEQFTLLATVISQQGNSLNVEDQSLQECVSLTLKQADWFKDVVRHELIGGGIEDLAKDAVEEVVESEVESYFNNNFDPSYHFDFDDAVSNEVSDQLDDVVRDRLDDVVAEQLEELVAEKLKGIRIVFE